MGSWFSRADPFAAYGMGPDPRPPLVYSRAQFLDLVLIRSKTRINGFGVDSRIAAAMRAGSLGLQLPPETLLPKWDRVGLLQLPSFLERHQYTADNIEVTEATFSGVQTRTLRQVCDSAMEVVIRPLNIGSQVKREEEAAARRRAREQAEALGSGAEPQEMKGDFGPDDAGGLEDEENERLDFLTKYYQFTGPVVNRAYGACMDKLESMFRWVMSSLRRFELGAAEEARMKALLEKHVVDFTGLDGKAARGIPFSALLPTFRDMARSANASLEAARAADERDAIAMGAVGDSAADGGVSNTFSDSEIFELVSAFTLGDDRISLSNSGYISVSEFLAQWRASLERTSVLRRVPREILSGAFVSQALQAMGMLPQSDQHYFLPMHFAMTAPPAEGWASLDVEDGAAEIMDEASPSGGSVVGKEKSKSAAQKKREAELRERVRKEERERTAHLPQLGPPPPPPSAAHDDAAAVGGDHSAIRVAGSSSSKAAASDFSEGLAILHLHAHGVARIGVEHQVLPPPPPEQQR